MQTVLYGTKFAIERIINYTANLYNILKES